jgi:hypothetical protein
MLFIKGIRPDILVVPCSSERGLELKLVLTVSLGLFCILQDAIGGSITLGSIQGQDGWSGGASGPISPSVDQEVTNAAAYNGSQSLRVSNNGFNGAFGGWIFGPGLANAAGQASSGAPADRFVLSLLFKSVNTFADGSNLEIDLGNSAGDDRTTFTAISNYADGNGGLTLRAAEPMPDGNFYPTNLVSTGLSRTVWHRLDITGFYFDGLANDYFQISLDGGPPIVSPNTSLSQWATFEAYNAATSGPYNLANRIFMRSGAAPSSFLPSAPNTAGGFYIDNVSYQSWNSANPNAILSSYSTGFEDTSSVPEPGSVSMLAIGFGALILAVRRGKLSGR